MSPRLLPRVKIWSPGQSETLMSWGKAGRMGRNKVLYLDEVSGRKGRPPILCTRPHYINMTFITYL